RQQRQAAAPDRGAARLPARAACRGIPRSQAADARSARRRGDQGASSGGAGEGPAAAGRCAAGDARGRPGEAALDRRQPDLERREVHAARRSDFGESKSARRRGGDRDVLEVGGMGLTAGGCAVTAVESGEAALSALSVSRPQVVVTDLRMAGMDGMALFDAIHRDSPSLPVVILTAHGTIPEAVMATRRGVFSVLTKPFEPKVLLE